MCLSQEQDEEEEARQKEESLSLPENDVHSISSLPSYFFGSSSSCDFSCFFVHVFLLLLLCPAYHDSETHHYLFVSLTRGTNNFVLILSSEDESQSLVYFGMEMIS